MAMSPAMLAMLQKNKAKYAEGGGKAYQLKEGRTVMRLLPAANPEDQFWADLGVHWIKPDKDAKPIAVVGDPDICYGRMSELTPLIDKAMDAAKAGGLTED